LNAPGTLVYGTAYTAKIDYDGANGFTFTVDIQSKSFNTGPARQRDAVTGYKGLTTGAYSDGGSGTGYTSALFDNVYINNQVAVYDDFSTAPLDQTKWQSLEVAREISGGKLQLNVQGDGGANFTNGIEPVEKTGYIEAKLLVESGSLPGTNGHMRMIGIFYNESRGPGSGLPYNGLEGDAWVTNRIELDGSGNLTAAAGVWRFDDPNDGNIGTSRFWGQFPTKIDFDTEYTLSIRFTMSQLVFTCNNDTLISFGSNSPKLAS